MRNVVSIPIFIYHLIKHLAKQIFPLAIRLFHISYRAGASIPERAAPVYPLCLVELHGFPDELGGSSIPAFGILFKRVVHRFRHIDGYSLHTYMLLYDHHIVYCFLPAQEKRYSRSSFCSDLKKDVSSVITSSERWRLRSCNVRIFSSTVLRTRKR